MRQQDKEWDREFRNRTIKHTLIGAIITLTLGTATYLGINYDKIFYDKPVTQEKVKPITHERIIYIAKKGDTYTRIASKLHLNKDSLKSYNKLEKIAAGDTVYTSD